MKNYITVCIMLEKSTNSNGALEFAKYNSKKKHLLSKSWSVISKSEQKKLNWKKYMQKKVILFFLMITFPTDHQITLPNLKAEDLYL